MVYKVYRKEKGSDSVELVNDESYQTKEEAERAMREAQEAEEEKEKNQKTPFPGEVLGPGQTNLPGKELAEGIDLPKEEKVEFFYTEKLRQK